MPENFSQLLEALQGPLAVGVIAWVAPWGLGGFAFWQGLPSKSKSRVVLGFSAVLGLFAVWFNTPPEWVAAAEPYVKAVLAIAGSWLATQVAHRKNEKANLASIKPQLEEAYDEAPPVN